MAYTFYLGDLMLPVAPGQLSLKIKNQNKTVNLIDEGEINILKKAGLTEISFKALFPNALYPFAQYKDGFREAAYFLENLEKLKTSQLPFRFIVSRVMPGGKLLFDNDILVSLEEYKPVEDTIHGFDIMIDVTLKQFKPYSTKTVNVTSTAVTIDVVRESPPSEIGIGSTVILNGRLHRDSYGAGPGQTRTNYRGKINFVNEKGSHPYHVTDMEGSWLGWVLKSAVEGA